LIKGLDSRFSEHSIKSFQVHEHIIRHCLLLNSVHIGKMIRTVYQYLFNHHWLEKRKGKVSYSDLHQLLF